MHPSCASLDFLQYKSSAGKEISSSNVEPIFLNVLTGGRYPRKIRDSKFFELDIWHLVTALEYFLVI